MLDILNQFFSFTLEKKANKYGYEVTVWNEFGLSCRAEGIDERELIANLRYEVESNNWG